MENIYIVLIILVLVGILAALAYIIFVQRRSLTDLEEEHKQAQEQTIKDQSALSAQTSLLEKAEEKVAQQDSELIQIREDRARLQEREQQTEELDKRLKKLSTDALQENREKLVTEGKSAYSTVLEPLQKEFKEFKSKFEQLTQDSQKEIADLKGVVRTTNQNAEGLNKKALDLVQALQVSPQMRGKWGEIVLERLLQSAGMVEGQHYSKQASYRTDENKTYRPDFILNLPHNRFVVIDVKTPMNLWTEAVEASNAAETDSDTASDINSGAAFGRFISGVDQHLRELSQKDYTAVIPGSTFELCLMYIPIEGAWIYLQQHATRLREEAFDKKISIVSATTLMPLLKLIEQMWRDHHRIAQLRETITAVKEFEKKMETFGETFAKVGTQLTTAQQSFQRAESLFGIGRGNLQRRMETVINLGDRAFEKDGSEDSVALESKSDVPTENGAGEDQETEPQDQDD